MDNGEKNKLNIRQSGFVALKILLSIFVFVISFLYITSSSILFKVLSIVLLAFNFAQLLCSIYSLITKRYTKGLMVFDTIHGLVFTIISAILMVTFFKNTVIILKALLLGYLFLKIILRIFFLVRNYIKLFKKDISTAELYKLKRSFLLHYIIKNVVCLVVLGICYLFSSVYLPIAEKFNLYTNF